MSKITIYFKGDFYGYDYEGYNTLSAVIRDFKLNRKDIKEWIKH